MTKFNVGDKVTLRAAGYPWGLPFHYKEMKNRELTVKSTSSVLGSSSIELVEYPGDLHPTERFDVDIWNTFASQAVADVELLGSSEWSAPYCGSDYSQIASKIVSIEEVEAASTCEITVEMEKEVMEIKEVEMDIISPRGSLDKELRSKYQLVAKNVAKKRAEVDIYQEAFVPGMMVYHKFKNHAAVLLMETKKGFWTIEHRDGSTEHEIPAAILTPIAPNAFLRLFTFLKGYYKGPDNRSERLAFSLITTFLIICVSFMVAVVTAILSTS